MTNFKDAFKQTLKMVFLKLGYRVSRVDTLFFFEPILSHYLKTNKEIFLVQIGANDGKMSDPIHQFITRNKDKLGGILIEPMKDTFEQLRYNYRNYPSFKAVNIGIHNSEKEMTLYKVDPVKLKKLPDWAKGIASFDKDHHKRSNIKEDFIIPEKVKCISFDELLKNYQITKIDLLQIDTEGYDSEIILNINYDNIKPSIINFEHGLQNGIMSNETFSKVIDLLHKNGYEIVIEKNNATAYQLFSLLDQK